jgi:hypothetical protein
MFFAYQDTPEISGCAARLFWGKIPLRCGRSKDYLTTDLPSVPPLQISVTMPCQVIFLSQSDPCRS